MDTRTFIQRLEAEGELKRIDQPLDPVLEISELARRVMQRNGPALLCTHPAGYDHPVLINQFGSRRRMSLALGVNDLQDAADEIDALTQLRPPGDLSGKLRMLPVLARMAETPPRVVKSGPCQEVVHRGADADLEALPHLKCWPDDGGRYITLPMVFSHDPVTGRRNCGMYRIQVMGRHSAAMHWQAHKTGAEHARQAQQLGQPIDVAVALGGDPVLTWAATAPLPPGIDEMMLAGFLRRKSVSLCQAITVDVQVPADAEIVIEGRVYPDQPVMEGPFGDHTGYYSLADLYPSFQITAITHRKDPIYPATVVGPPPMEDAWLGKATERLFLPLLRLMLPEIVDINLPVEACFHNLALVSIRKRYPGHARKVMHALWGLGQMMFSKIIVVVDDDVDVQRPEEVVWRATNNIDPQRDCEFVLGPVDMLDHASRLPGYGSKMGIDATRKWASEGFIRDWPEVARMSDEVIARLDALWPELGLDGPH